MVEGAEGCVEGGVGVLEGEGSSGRRRDWMEELHLHSRQGLCC